MQGRPLPFTSEPPENLQRCASYAGQGRSRQNVEENQKALRGDCGKPWRDCSRHFLLVGSAHPLTGVSEIDRRRHDGPVPSGGTTEINRTPSPSKEALGKGRNPGCYRTDHCSERNQETPCYGLGACVPKDISKASPQVKRGLWRGLGHTGTVFIHTVGVL